MGKARLVLGSLVVLLGFGFGPALLAQPPAPEKKIAVRKLPDAQFLRIRRDAKKQPAAMETAIVRYVAASGEGALQVDLISVVHVGDRGYYERLNDHFEQYDALLYELVAPEGTRVPKGGKRDSDNPLAMIQQIAQVVLELQYQTEQIDYTKKNFVHADLSPQKMAEAIRKRGDDGYTLFLGLAADFLRQHNLQEMKKPEQPAADGEETDIFSLLLDPYGPAKMKRALAEQLVKLEAPDGGLGNTLRTILITDRNEAAMKVFQKELAKGKKKIGIFYGAGHMPDFDKRLRADFGLKRDKVEWLNAWDLRMKRRSLDALFEKLIE